MTVLYTNARSISSKLSDLSTLISEHDPDLILITESWCNKDTTNAFLNVPGYYIDPDLRLDRIDTANGIGGGLLVYIKDGLDVLPIDNTSNFNQYKQFAVKSSNNCTNDLNITLIYRSPNSSSDNTKLLCDIIEHSPKNGLIIGDFNLPKIDWNTGIGDSKSKQLIDTSEKKFLTQLVTFPTHQKGNILDLAFTDIPDKILNIETVGNLGSSDHSVIRLDISFTSNFNFSCDKILDWKNADIEGFDEFLQEVNWTEHLGNLDTEQSWSFFKDKVDEGIDTFIPKMDRRKKNRPCWIDNKVSKLSRRKQKLWKNYIKDSSDVNFQIYKLAEKELKRTVRNAKRNFEKKLSKSENKKCFNSYVKSKLNSRVPIGPLKVNKETVSENIDIANVLNGYFCSVFTKEDTSNIPVPRDMNCNSTLSNVVFEPLDIIKKIEKLKPSSSSGPDNLSTKFLHTFRNSISEPLSIIYNKSMQSGCVPQDWRSANITPIFKKGSKTDPSNFRPISLTSVPCKLMESVIKDHIMDHLLTNELILSSQHGFMKRKSCLTNLLDFFEYVTSEVDRGNPVDTIYLDFSKAFDKVPHQRLLAKLKSHKISDNVLTWIEHWLMDRKQRTVINGEASEWAAVLSGVPQGSVLGPLAFIVFINDLDFAATLIDIINKFADDTKVGHVIKNITNQTDLQDCLDKLCDWAKTWGMQFNEKKCKVIHFGRSNPKFDYYMNNIKLTEVSEEVDVGVKIHSSLKPSKHCAEIARRANGILGQLSKSFHYRDKRTFVNLYKT